MAFNTHEIGTSTSNFASEMLKRQREDDRCGLNVYSKRPCYSDILFIPEVSPAAVSGDESVYSMQGWETEFCQDTPDTSSHDEDSDDLRDLRDRLNGRLPTIEYEVASLSEAENPFGRSGSSDSSSSENDMARVTEIVVEVDNVEEEAFWGDDSHSDTHTSSTDQEISPCDFWTCLRCKCVNKPIPRYCKRCFKVRKNWFPERPRHTLKKKKKLRQRNRGVRDNSNKNDDVESGLGSFSMKETAGSSSSSTLIDSQSSSFNSEQQSQTSEIDTKAPDIETVLKNDKCITCMQRPKNAVFVHGTAGHICCCYKCAKKCWSSTGKCPVCNRKTNCVVKAFVA